MGKFRQTISELWPLIDVKNCIFFSFPLSNLSSFLSIFFKLCILVDTGKDWFGIVDGYSLSAVYKTGVLLYIFKTTKLITLRYGASSMVILYITNLYF